MQANILGIELNNDFSQISYYDEQIDEVVTYKTVTGEEQIPMAISYFDDQWEIGNKAMEIYKDYPDKVSKDIFNFAISRSMVYQGGIKYPAVVLLTHYIEKLLAKFSSTEYLTFVVSDANIDTTGMLISIGTRLGINKNKIFVIDNKEAFCRYMLYQPKELWQYESALFTCDEKEMKAYMLKSIKPDLDKQREFIIVDKVGSARLDELNAIKPFVANLNKTADESFTDFVKSIFDKKVISSVFLTGVGFEDQWYPETLKYITNGRRSFIGNNLFSKGGVYLSYSKKYVTSKVPIYLDKNKLTDEVCVYMRVNGKEGWFPIVAPGFSWYEADGKFEVIPKDIDRIEIHIENVLNGDVKTDYIDLSELKLRTDYSTRLQIDIRFIDETTLNLIVKDLGFGDFFKASGFTTTKTISLGGYHGQFDFMS